MSFFDSIKNLMRLSVISQELTSHELQQLNLAIVTLMIEMIRADFIELQKEKNILKEVLNASLELSSKEIDLLIEKAEVQSDYTLSLQSHTSIINNYLPKEGKVTLLKNLWILANSDSNLHALEINMLNKVAEHLGYSKNQLNTIINNED